MSDILVPAHRPDDTTLWIPGTLARRVGAKRGGRMTDDQFQHPEIQEWIRAHTTSKKATE